MDIDNPWGMYTPTSEMNIAFGITINCLCVKCNNSFGHPRHKGPQCYHLSCWLATIGKGLYT